MYKANGKAKKQFEDRTSSLGLLRYAEAYYAGYELIQKQHPESVDTYFPVKYYLLCHSLELAMKSWLRHQGATYVELKAISHDLELAMDALKEKCGFTFDVTEQDIIRAANSYYSKRNLSIF